MSRAVCFRVSAGSFRRLMSPNVNFICVVSLCAAAEASIVGCIWLLFKLSSLRQSLRGRLFPTQLRCLAVADLIFLFSALPGILVNNQMLTGLGDLTLNEVCKWSWAGLQLGRHLSLWIEMHIAMTFMVQSARLINSEQCRCFLPVLPLPCLVLTLFSFWNRPWTFDAVTTKTCSPSSWKASACPVSLADMILCMGVCSCCYMVVVHRNRKTQCPGSVQAAGSRRAEMFIVNAFLTYTLVLVVYLDARLYDNIYFRTLAGTMENLGGLFNTVTYGMHSRYARAFSGDNQTLNIDLGHRRTSYPVGIGDTDVSDVTALSLISSSAVSASQCSPGVSVVAACRPA